MRTRDSGRRPVGLMMWPCIELLPPVPAVSPRCAPMACALTFKADADRSSVRSRDLVSKGAAARRAARGVTGDIAVFSSLSLEEGFGLSLLSGLSVSGRVRAERCALRGEERVEP